MPSLADEPDTPPAPVTLSAVVPLLNEQESLPELYRRLTDTLTALGVEYELRLVNDGSTVAPPWSFSPRVPSAQSSGMPGNTCSQRFLGFV